MQFYSTVGSNMLDRAMPFYEALLSSIGWGRLFDNPDGGRFFGSVGGGFFGVLTPFDGAPATCGNGSMAGFGLDSFAAVDAFHALALDLGAKDEGAPGLRSSEAVGAYFAYFRDLDGNKLCAYHFGPKQA